MLDLVKGYSLKMNMPDSNFHIYDNFRTILSKAGMRVAPDITICEAHHMHCLTGIPHPFGNLVIVGEMPQPAYFELLAYVEDWSRQNQAPIGLILFSHMGAAEKGAFAAQRNWMLMEDMPGMWLDIPDDFEIGSLPPGTDLKTVDDRESLEKVTRAVAEGYPVPPEAADFFMRGIQLAGEAEDGSLANFLITVDGETAACSSVCISDNVAGIYCVATLEQFRGRGLGAAVTRAAIKYAMDRGARNALLHATGMGESIYRRIGFEERCRVPAYGFGLDG